MSEKPVLVVGAANFDIKTKTMLKNFLRVYYCRADEATYEARMKVLWNHFHVNFNKLKDSFVFPDEDTVYNAMMNHNLHELERMVKGTTGYLEASQKKKDSGVEACKDFLRFLAEGLQGNRLPFDLESFLLKVDSLCES